MKTVKNTSHLIWDSNTMYYGELRSDRGSRLVIEFFLQFSSFNLNDNFMTGVQSSYIFLKLVYFTNSETREREDLSGKDSHLVPVSSSHVEEMIERGDPLCSDITEWPQEFRENLVDDRVPEHRDAHASSSHELSLEPTSTRSEDLGKHSVYTHFPKDRNYEICQRTKITRAPCRRRIGGAVLRAENFGDLITADHKIVSEGCESRNNHRYAVVVQDLATQWIQPYPCKTKTSQETQRKVLGARQETLTILWDLAMLVKIFPGIIVRRHHTDRKQMGLLKEQCAE